MRLPPLHALAALEAAARLGSFSEAARELYVTPSAISHRIRLLEDHLGAEMFVRTHNQVSLTPDGERFVDTVRQALAHLVFGAKSLAAARAAR
jgi:LysR family glycine cleavage system transcriptional activator